MAERDKRLPEFIGTGQEGEASATAIFLILTLLLIGVGAVLFVGTGLLFPGPL
ncbi:MAG: hypothetical protein M0Z94_08185 [Dehalococcoidales bacterium]|nr:hypothetical protein [Dehalococcoidales bacterium]